MDRFQDKVVIVTGAGTGMGRAIAEEFIQNGANVALIGRRLAKLEEVSSSFPKDRAMLCACDVSDRAAVGDMVTEVISRFGTVNILVNNAGINVSPRTVADIDPADWDQIVDINLTGVFNTIRAVLPVMREKKDGLIINISSIAGLRGGTLAGASYAASKHGVVALSDTLNEEERDFNIRSCAICPGEVDTPMLDQRPEPLSREHLDKIIKPEDVASAVCFVAAYPPRVCIPLLVIKPTTQIFL
jgi:NADP-dependent 3-hydroxy acid dehydrogenase YdfG